MENVTKYSAQEKNPSNDVVGIGGRQRPSPPSAEEHHDGGKSQLAK